MHRPVEIMNILLNDAELLHAKVGTEPSIAMSEIARIIIKKNIYEKRDKPSNKGETRESDYGSELRRSVGEVFKKKKKKSFY